jgi:hypothetical protein
MRKLDIPIIVADVRGERHSCGGRCNGKPRKDGYCYHDGGTRHRIGQCRDHHVSTPRPARTDSAPTGG